MLKRYGDELLIFLFFILLFGLISLTKGQPIGFDIYNYHYYSGYAFWAHRLGHDIAPAGIQTYFNPLFDAFNYFLYQHMDPRAVAIILGALCGLNGYFLYKISALFFKDAPFLVVLSLALGVTGATALGQVGNPMNDSQSAILVLGGIYLLLKNRPVFSFLILGMAMGLKMTNALYLPAAFLAWLFCFGVRERAVVRTALFSVFCAVFGFLLIDGYFAYHLFRLFGNPMFPYYNNLFHSPYFEETTLRDARFGVHVWYQIFTYPFVLMKNTKWVFSEPGCRDWRLGVFFMLSAIALLRRRPQSDVFRFSALFLLFSYILWAYEFGIFRYAIPLQLLSGPLIINLLSQLISKKKGLYFWGFVLTCLIIVTTVHPNFNYQKSFTQPYIAIDAPRLPAHSLVLMTGAVESFVIPFFAPDIRFLGVNVSPLLNAKILNPLIAQNTGPIFAIFNPVNDTLGHAISKERLHAHDCHPLPSNVSVYDIPHMEICAVPKGALTS